MPVATSDELFFQLKDHLGLPENCTKLVLTLEVDEAAKLECTYLAQTIDAEPLTKTYNLVEEEQ